MEAKRSDASYASPRRTNAHILLTVYLLRGIQLRLRGNKLPLQTSARIHHRARTRCIVLAFLRQAHRRLLIELHHIWSPERLVP